MTGGRPATGAAPVLQGLRAPNANARPAPSGRPVAGAGATYNTPTAAGVRPGAGAGAAPGGDVPGIAGSSAVPGAGVPPRGAVRDAPESLRLGQDVAERLLRGSGIGWRSTGGCSERAVATCTSFENVRWGTIKGVIGFAESSGCEITVTGGTERGHARGARSHWNGYKLDIATGVCVDRAIERYPEAGVRGDGARLYRSPDGALFAREKDHWDITVR